MKVIKKASTSEKKAVKKILDGIQGCCRGSM